MLETELKSIITKDLYEKIKNEFNWDSAAEQVNHYYSDKNNILQKNRIMARVRVKNGISKIQVKLHKNENSPLQICEETEFDISSPPKIIDADKAKKITGLDVGELHEIGVAKTFRHSLMWNSETEICLDKTDYFDVTDYEIEVEYKGEADSVLLKRLNELGVNFKEKSVGKFSRFLSIYNAYH